MWNPLSALSHALSALGAGALIRGAFDALGEEGAREASERLRGRFTEHRDRFWPWLLGPFKERNEAAFARIWRQQQRRQKWRENGFTRSSEDEMNKALGDLYAGIMSTAPRGLADDLREVLRGAPAETWERTKPLLESLREASSYDPEELCMVVFQELAAMSDEDFETALDALTEDGPIRYLLRAIDMLGGVLTGPGAEALQATLKWGSSQLLSLDEWDKRTANNVREWRNKAWWLRGA